MALHTHTERTETALEILDALNAFGEFGIPSHVTTYFAQLRREFRHQCELREEARQLIQDNFTEWKKDPKTGELLKDERKRRIPAPVVAKNPDGSVKYKTDDKGNPTTEPEILHGKIAITDTIGYDRALRDWRRETITVRVPHLPWKALEAAIKTLPGNAVAALVDYFDDFPRIEDDEADGAVETLAAEEPDASGAASGAGKKSAKAGKR